jgi:D-amino-acid dehydrogenase
MKVIVLGAGVVGVSSAWYLKRNGHDVVVIDRQPAAGLETSFANGAQLSVSQSEPWAAPGAPWKVMKWLLKDDAPLLFRPKLDWHQMSWGLRFLFECTPWRFKRNIREMVNLGLYTRRCLHELVAETGIEYDGIRKGILQFYTSGDDFEAAKQASRALRPFGILREVKSAEEAIAIEPALASMRDRLAGATYAADDESGDAHKFTQNLARLCAARGIEFKYGANVETIETEAGSVSGVRVRHSNGSTETVCGDAYVCSMGSYSYLMLKQIGITIPVYPAKGYSATLSTEGFSGAPQVSLTDEAMKIVFSRLGNRMRIAGTAELDGYSTSLSVVRTEMLVKRARELFPGAADYDKPTYWTGLRPSTPSNCPLIGRCRYANLYLNTGHGTLGWTEGLGSGAALADLMSGKVPQVEYRFLGRS